MDKQECDPRTRDTPCVTW